MPSLAPAQARRLGFQDHTRHRALPNHTTRHTSSRHGNHNPRLDATGGIGSSWPHLWAV